VYTHITPIHQLSWNQELKNSWNKLRNGNVPRKWDGSSRELIKTVGASLAKLMQEIVSLISDFVSTGREDNVYAQQVTDPEASAFTISNLTESTKNKISRPGLKTHIWTFSQSSDPTRRELLGR